MSLELSVTITAEWSGLDADQFTEGLAAIRGALDLLEASGAEVPPPLYHGAAALDVDVEP